MVIILWICYMVSALLMVQIHKQTTNTGIVEKNRSEVRPCVHKPGPWHGIDRKSFSSDPVNAYVLLMFILRMIVCFLYSMLGRTLVSCPLAFYYLLLMMLSFGEDQKRTASVITMIILKYTVLGFIYLKILGLYVFRYQCNWIQGSVIPKN